MTSLAAVAGYDDELIDALPTDDAGFFTRAAVASSAAVALVAIGLGYGAWLALHSVVVALLTAGGAALVTANLFRLLHAGTGYPVHAPLERLDRWRPAILSVAVLLLLGAIVVQPLVLLAFAPFFSGAKTDGVVLGGLIGRALVAYRAPGVALSLTALFALVVAAPAWLRFFSLRAVRAYERERWRRDRALIDGAYADTRTIVEDELAPFAGFTGVVEHFADPPYNTRPLVFGIDPGALEKKGLRFARPWERGVPVLEAPPPPPPPLPVEKPPVERPISPALVKDVESGLSGETPPLDWAEPLVDDGNPPPLTYFDLGRATGKHARPHADALAPFLVELTGRSESEVRTMLRVAPDDIAMHQLFSEWKRLPVILMKTAGFARDHGFAKVLSIAVGLPVDEVEARLAAAPRDTRITGVFTRELARRVLGRARV